MAVLLTVPHPTSPLGRHLGRPHRPSRALVGQFLRFTAVGTGATALQMGIYLALRVGLGPQTANLLALASSTLLSIELNRQVTFGEHSHKHLARQYGGSFAVFLLGLALSSAALAALTALAPGAGRPMELVMLVAVAVVVGILRFTLLREWVFPGSRRGGPAPRA